MTEETPEETPEATIFSLITALAEDPSNEEANVTINRMNILTQNLEPFDNVLSQVTEANKMAIIIPSISTLMRKRGCLLSIPVLSAHLEVVCRIFAEKADLLIATNVYRIFAEMVAVSYRFLLQASFYENNIIPFTFIFEKLGGTVNERIIALTTLFRIVTDIKENRYQLLDTQHQDFRGMFYKKMLRMYFECTFPFIENPEDATIDQTLDLLLACLQFTTHNEDMLMFKFNVPVDWVDFYTDTRIPEKLFRIYAQGSINAGKKALDALLLFSSAVDSTWKAMDQHIAFINTIAAQLKEAILKQGMFESMSETADLELSRLICKIGMVLPLQYFIQDGISAEFFDAIRMYTEEHFTQMTFNGDDNSQTICFYMLNFWGRTASICSNNPQNYDQGLLSLFPSIFNIFVKSYLDNIINYPDLSNIIEDPETILPHFEALWNLVLISPKECIDMLTENVNQAIAVMQSGDSVGQALIRLSVLIIMIASRFLIRTYSYFRAVRCNPEQAEQKAELVKNVFNIINASGEIQEALVANFPGEAVILEKSIVLFAKAFKRDMFTQKADVMAVYEAMGFGEAGRKIAFDLFVNRFISDLTGFQGNFFILNQILIYIDDIFKNSKELVELATANEAMQNLIQRKAIIAFQTDSWKDQKKLITLLNTIYARILLSVDDVKTFLSFLDAKFDALSKTSPPFADQTEVFTIFCEIRGILHGCSSIPNFVYVARWYLNNYVDVACQCLALHGSEPEICTAILQSWGYIAANKGVKLIFGPGSCDGIRIFKASLSIVQVTLEKVDDEEVKISVLKLINSSLTQTYCNFGVMKFFGDEDQFVMIQTLFDLLSSLSPADLGDKQKFAVVSSITSVVNIFGPIFLQNDAYRAVAFEFLRYTIDSINDHADTWKKSCEALTAILTCAAVNEGFEAIFSELRVHFLTILDAIINETTSVVDNACGPFYLMGTRDGEFVSKVFESLIGAFDPENQPRVNEIIQEFVVNIPAGEDISLDIPKQFRFALSKFKIDMVRFPISVKCIPDFAEIFNGPQE